MFGLGFGEIMIILVLALLLLGPKKLPDAAKTIGKGLREFRKATDDLRGQIETEINVLDQDKPPPKPALVPGSRRSIGSGPVLPATVDNVPGLDAALAEAPSAASAPATPDAPPVTASDSQPGEPAAPAAGSASEAVKSA
jgi:sec-independent protein translocase protein TatB